MTQEEKELLLKDLCGRLRSGLICSIYREDDEGFGWRDAECKGYFQNNDSYEFYFEDVIAIDNIERLKPYLRPMLSMTEEELDELLDCEDIDFDGKSELVKRAMLAFAEGDKLLSNALFSMQYAKTVDWLNAHHFDYRGLIKKGLAIEAPEGMYNNVITK